MDPSGWVVVTVVSSPVGVYVNARVVVAASVGAGVGGGGFGGDVPGHGHRVPGVLGDRAVGAVAVVDDRFDQPVVPVIPVPGGRGVQPGPVVGVAGGVGAGGEVPAGVVGVRAFGDGPVGSGGGLGRDLVDAGVLVLGGDPVAAVQAGDPPVLVVLVVDLRQLRPVQVTLDRTGGSPAWL